MRGQYVAENEGHFWPINAYNFLIPLYQVRMTHLTTPKYISQKYEMKKKLSNAMVLSFTEKLR